MSDLFDQIAQIAANGERCPFGHSIALGDLARAGKIRIEIFKLNWRVVTILQGPHKGKQTMAPPKMTSHNKPYLVIDSRSTQRRYKIPLRERQAPWKPGTPR